MVYFVGVHKTLLDGWSSGLALPLSSREPGFRLAARIEKGPVGSIRP